MLNTQAKNLQFHPNPNEKISQKIGNSQLPHSIEAEINVLGAMMMSPDFAIPKVLEVIKAEDFYRIKHYDIFKAIVNLYEKKVKIDLLTVKEELKRLGKHEIIGGDLYLLEINRKTPSSANVHQHALIVYEKALKRRTVKFSSNLYKSAVDESLNIVDVIQDGIINLKELYSFKSRSNPDQDAIEYKNELIRRTTEKDIFTRTGLRSLDKIIHGFYPGEFVLIGGRPGAGKTALGVTISYNLAFKMKKKALIISVELTKIQWMDRLVSVATGIPYEELKDGKIDKNKMAEITKYLFEFASNKYYLQAEIKYIEDIVLEIKSYVTSTDVNQIFIDNLQNIRSKKTFKNEAELKSYISNTLRDLAKELGVNICLLIQLNREVSKRKSKQPIKEDIRNSGDLEQDAHVIVLIDRPEAERRYIFDDKADATNRADLVVVKNRDFPTGVTRLYYRGELMRFETIDYYHKNENPEENPF